MNKDLRPEPKTEENEEQKVPQQRFIATGAIVLPSPVSRN